MSQQKIETVEGEIVNIIYFNEDNGYKVVEVENDTDFFTAVGILHGVSVGENIKLSGRWTNHSVYGEQFNADFFEKQIPSTRSSILRYLSSGIIKGIRETTAKKIVEKFGEKALDVLANEPIKLSQIKGISTDKAMAMHESYNSQVGASSLVMFLQQHGISANFAVKIYKIYGSSAIDMINSNPYILCENIDGITFKTSDKIAMDLKFSPDCPERLRAGAVYTLKYYTQYGHSYLPRQVLCDYTSQIIGVSAQKIDIIVDTLINDRHFALDIYNNEQRIYLYSLYKCEENVAKKIIELNKVEYDFNSDDIKKQIDIAETTGNMKLARLQREAVENALKYSVLVITGCPGTGKTTIINAIIDVMHANGLSVTLTAPTGRAAKRMSEVCHTEAKTIHRLLEAGFRENSQELDFAIDEDNPIDTDVVIVDEMSMVDIVLMNSLLRAIKYGTRLIMVGDVNQLPSVGPGNVLRDIIESDSVRVIRLNEIFRQAKESMIIVNAHEINKGNYPKCNIKDKNFFFMPHLEPQSGYDCIMSLCSERLPKAYNISPFDIQVLSPAKKGINGVFNLNKGLQSVLNPEDSGKKEKKYGDIIFREGDKVMQIKNNYDLTWSEDGGKSGEGVFNGDVGVIEKINDKFGTLTVLYDENKRVVYDFKNLDELDLAYAVTVHKSQGSEFSVVIIPMYDAPYMLVNRNLFYTGVTRAKEIVILVGREDIVKKMVDNNRENKRYSGLREKIVEKDKLKNIEEFF